MAAVVTLIAQDGDTIDSLAWREATLGPESLVLICNANPRLSERVVLAAGDLVIIPPALIAGKTPATMRPRIELWD
jgi:phage tail protein X